MADADDREVIISQILQVQKGLQRTFAYDRSVPFLATTLTMQQLKTLLILSFSNDVSGHELADHLGARLGTVTGIVDRLVAQDLVRRQEDPSDRRVRRVSLTDAGHALVGELSDSGMDGFRKVLVELDTDTLRCFHHVLDKLVEAARRLDPPMRDRTT
ncbi:MAG: MarR family winged helix-turn-helix transcriptional regulator [Stackebrandtia sp.]